MNLDGYFISAFNEDAVNKVSDYGKAIIEGKEIDTSLLLSGPAGNGKGLLTHRLEEYLKSFGKKVENVKAIELDNLRCDSYMNLDLMIIRNIEAVLKSSEKLQELMNVAAMLHQKNIPLVLTSTISGEKISEKMEEARIATPSMYEKICFIKLEKESFAMNLGVREINRIAGCANSLSHIIGLLNLISIKIKYMNRTLQEAITEIIG